MSKEPSRKAARITEDCFAALVRSYLATPKFQKYAEETRRTWTRELNFAARPDLLGTLSIQEIRPALVQAFFDGLTDRPGKQRVALAAFRQLERWAVLRDILPRQITFGIELEDCDGGHTPWTDEQVDLAIKHARPDLARVVLLAANTGQRGSDLVRMGPTDLETFDGIEGIRIVQKKTGREQWIPINSTLAAAMATWERRPGPFLTRPDGRPWKRTDLSTAWGWHRDTNPALAPLKGLVLHGLRSYACVALVRAGCNTRQIADVVGMSEKTVARYTRLSSQQANASAAVHLLDRTRRERQAQ